MLGRAEVASREVMRDLVREAARESAGPAGSRSPSCSAEWDEVVDAWQLDSWEAYRDVARLGRKTRLPEKQRQALWAIFERVRAGLNERRLVTQADLYSRLAAHLAAGERPPYDFVVVDEAQDVSVAQLRFVAALGGGRPDALFFAGDLGQRIFQLPFSWRSLGVDIRGRSGTLRINYRTSHQIRAQADRLLGTAGHRRGRQHGGAGRHDLGVQRAGPGGPRARQRRGGVRGGGPLAGGARVGGRDARGDERLRPLATPSCRGRARRWRRRGCRSRCSTTT